MLTVIGIILILFSCTALAMQKIIKEKEKTEIARAFRRLFSYLAEKMEFTQEPILPLLRQSSEVDLGEAEDFVKELIGRLSDGKGQTLGEAWQGSLHSFADKLNLTPCMRRILKNAGSGLGQIAAKVEIENLACVCRELDEEIARSEKEYAVNAKMIRSAGILFGILIVILFI